MSGVLSIPASVLHDFYVQVLVRTGVPEADAHLAAAVRLEGALRLPAGLDAFTVIRLQNTVHRIQAGGINPTPRLRVVQERATSVELLSTIHLMCRATCMVCSRIRVPWHDT